MRKQLWAVVSVEMSHNKLQTHCGRGANPIVYLHKLCVDMRRNTEVCFIVTSSRSCIKLRYWLLIFFFNEMLIVQLMHFNLVLPPQNKTI